MHIPLVSDSFLAVLNFLVPVLLGALGVVFSLKPIKKKEWLRVSAFFLLAVIGCVSSYIQSAHSQAEAASAKHDAAKALQAKVIESEKIDAINGVIKTMASGIKSEITTAAAAQVQAIANGNSLITKQLASQPLVNTAIPQSLLDRASAMNQKLQGLEMDWGRRLDQVKFDVKKQRAEVSYANIDPKIRAGIEAADLNADDKEIRLKQNDVNLFETRFYRDKCEEEAEKLRSELVPLVPGVGDLSLNYNDAAFSWSNFWIIANDFNSLIAAYSDKLKTSR